MPPSLHTGDTSASAAVVYIYSIMLTFLAIFTSYPWQELYAPANIPNWILTVIGASGVCAAIRTLRTIEKQTAETARAATATENAVVASRDSLKVQEAEFAQWIDIGEWTLEENPKVYWARSGSKIVSPHPGEMNVRLRFPLTNNTARPLSIHSVQTVLEIGTEKTVRTVLVEERMQVPPRDEYSVVIDTKLSESHVSQYMEGTLFILASDARR